MPFGGRRKGIVGSMYTLNIFYHEKRLNPPPLNHLYIVHADDTEVNRATCPRAENNKTMRIPTPHSQSRLGSQETF